MPPPTAIHDSDDNYTADVSERRTELKEQQKVTSSDGTPSLRAAQFSKRKKSATTHWPRVRMHLTHFLALLPSNISSKIKQKPEALTKVPSPAPTEPQPALSARPSATVTSQEESWKQLWSKRKRGQEIGGGNLRKTGNMDA